MSDLIGTIPELEALPIRSVILDRQLLAWQKCQSGDWILGPMEASSADLLQAINNYQPAELIFRGPPR